MSKRNEGSGGYKLPACVAILNAHMSTMSPSTPISETVSDSWVAQHSEVLRRPVEALAFWAAIALPFAYLPLLYSGFESTSGVLLFAGLVVANVLALYVGHGHKRE